MPKKEFVHPFDLIELKFLSQELLHADLSTSNHSVSPKNKGKSLMIDAEIAASSNKTFEEYACITNVRNVEAEALIRVIDPARRRRRG